ncbi:transcriptional regulator [Ancylobacter pratisalsi]|uniref:Transcriptional regulator n=2 Tax=Ancylobacter pratisalsi TaxID=1745854 RepID=A0A6P1YRY3_9HYPH|nr:transcriptional regulator [Ancylobacter pratisalsi]
MRGETLASLSVAHGYDLSAFSKALKRPWPAVEMIIATFLDLAPKHIWPSRYDTAGRPLRRPSNGRRMADARLRQKSRAA